MFLKQPAKPALQAMPRSSVSCCFKQFFCGFSREPVFVAPWGYVSRCFYGVFLYACCLPVYPCSSALCEYGLFCSYFGALARCALFLLPGPMCVALFAEAAVFFPSESS